MQRKKTIQNKPVKLGTIAFITTPQYRISRAQDIERFVCSYMYSLCRHFNVMTTGRTYLEIKKIVDRKFNDIKSTNALTLICQDTGFPIRNENNLKQWRDIIFSGLCPTKSSFQGMIHITYELVEGRLDAVIHLTDWQDKSAKADSAVLSREANVHNVPIATNYDTAQAYVESWNALIAQRASTGPFFRKRQKPEIPPLNGIEKKHRVLAMVSHDNMKLEICRFAVENSAYIFKNYDYILATGTTGQWIKKFMAASNRSQGDIDKIRCCNSGPLGGDIQIAYAVVQGICEKIIFLQDPSVSHPHDSDIKLFEQAVASEDVNVKLATNVDSAKLLIYSP